MYRQILLADPQNADAYHLLGVLMNQVGQPKVAIELIGRAISINPSFAPYHNNLGNAFKGTRPAMEIRCAGEYREK